jgi:hypothetical protein
LACCLFGKPGDLRSFDWAQTLAMSATTKKAVTPRMFEAFSFHVFERLVK